MRMIVAGLSALALCGCVPLDMMGGMMGAGGIASNPEEAKQMSAALQQSQAAGAAQAQHPGDDKMTCGAIQAEMMTTMQDPKFKAAMASMGGRAGAEKARIDAATAGKATAPVGDEVGTYANATGADLISIMPQIMRNQRLNELAAAKSCEFAKGMPGVKPN